MLTITVPGKPAAKGRPRFSRHGAYTPASTVTAENWVKCCAVDQVGMPMLLEALAVTVQAMFSVPSSWSQKKAGGALAGLWRPTGRPDADNLGKTVLDALNGIVWKDDAQVVDLTISKTYGTEPKTIITVRAA